MNLTINGQSQKFIPIQEFREQWGLPDDFQVNLFEPKNWEGLGSIKGAGDVLLKMRAEVVGSVPHSITFANLLSAVDILSNTFRYQLEAANEQMGLRLHDVDFAVAGFYDVMSNVVYHLLHLKHSYQIPATQICDNFDFSLVYQNWLDASTRLSSTVHSCSYSGHRFEIRVVNHIYGRVGLEVRTGNELFYLLDKSLACPGENYMWDLCREVSQTVCNRLTA